MKECSRCKKNKPVSEFELIKKSQNVIKHCKSCVDEMEKEYLKIHTDNKGNYIEKPYIGCGRKKKQ